MTVISPKNFLIVIGSLRAYFLNELDTMNDSPIVMSIILALMLVVGLGFCYYFLFAHVWRYTFLFDRVLVRHSVYTKQYPIDMLQSLVFGSEIRTYRGRTSNVPLLTFTFLDGTKLKVEYGTVGGFPSEYSTVYAQEKLSNLFEMRSDKCLPE